MTNVIIVGHGMFAKGLMTAVDNIVGRQENVEYIDFIAGDTKEMLEDRIRYSIKRLENDHSLLFLTDLVGGRPFEVCAKISTEYENCGVIGGLNIPILLEVLFLKNSYSALEVMKHSVVYGKKAINMFPYIY